jgi:transposase
MFGHGAKTLYHWYRNYLSDYKEDIANKTLGNQKVYRADEETGEILGERTVFIAKPGNVGERMTIDDKLIGHSSYTVMSNSDTGKIAFMMDSTRCADLVDGVKLLGDSIKRVKHIACDMAPSYLKFCDTVLPWSEVTIDKFHVMKHVYDAVADVRNRLRKEKSAEMPRGKRVPGDDKVLCDMDLLRRSRHLLNQGKADWDADQQELMEQLLVKFPGLETAYTLAQDFKAWYSKDNVSKSSFKMEVALMKWFDKVEKSGLKEFDQCVKMIDKHIENILNYFSCAHTNAKAENINGKIQRFVTNNYGVKDKDFCLYRIKIYFS